MDGKDRNIDRTRHCLGRRRNGSVTLERQRAAIDVIHVLVPVEVFVNKAEVLEIESIALDGAHAVLLRNIGKNILLWINKMRKIKAAVYQIKSAIIRFSAARGALQAEN